MGVGKYPLFDDVRNTLNTLNPHWKKEIHSVLSKQSLRSAGEHFTLSEHIEAMLFSGLSSMRGWSAIALKRPALNKIFFNFDVGTLKAINPDDLSKAIKSINAGTFRINHQMRALKHNIETMEKIEEDHISIDDYYNSLCCSGNIEDKIILVLQLSKKEYKIKEFGIPLVCEYIKGMGIDIVKPDRHVCRILMRMGYVSTSLAKKDNRLYLETIRVCDDIAKSYGITNAEVDTILWQYCADGYAEICSSMPNCKKCAAKSNGCPCYGVK